MIARVPAVPELSGEFSAYNLYPANRAALCLADIVARRDVGQLHVVGDSQQLLVAKSVCAGHMNVARKA